MRRLLLISALSLAALGCGHSYGTPVVTTLTTPDGQQTDASWIVEDDGRIVRCTGMPRPRCERVGVQ